MPIQCPSCKPFGHNCHAKTPQTKTSTQVECQPKNQPTTQKANPINRGNLRKKSSSKPHFYGQTHPGNSLPVHKSNQSQTRQESPNRKVIQSTQILTESPRRQENLASQNKFSPPQNLVSESSGEASSQSTHKSPKTTSPFGSLGSKNPKLHSVSMNVF